MSILAFITWTLSKETTDAVLNLSTLYPLSELSEFSIFQFSTCDLVFGFTCWFTVFFLHSLRKRLSVSESSHTESDSSPPLTVRRRCCSAIIEMPRFAISSEEEGGQGKNTGRIFWWPAVTPPPCWPRNKIKLLRLFQWRWMWLMSNIWH